MSKYISVTETAKLIRKDLKANFPGVTFSVRSESYSGGASINVYWFDGPTDKEVESLVTNHYVGSTFDSMIDLKESVYTEHNGEKVRFGSDHVFTRRYMTNEVFEQMCEVVSEEYKIEIPVIKFLDESRRYDKYQEMFEIDQSQPHNIRYPDVDGRWRGYPNPSFHEIVSKKFHETSLFQKPEKKSVKSPTKTKSSDGLVCNVIYQGDWTWLDFSEKPEREILEKVNYNGMGFRWGKKRGQWYKSEIVDQTEIETNLDNVVITITVTE